MSGSPTLLGRSRHLFSELEQLIIKSKNISQHMKVDYLKIMALRFCQVLG